MGSTHYLDRGGRPEPPLPPGQFVELAGRGTTFVRESPRRAGAPSVMLLHGLAATGSLNWFTSFPALERDFHLMALDHRGHGRGIRDRNSFKLEDAADDAVRLADALDVERFIAVGYSMGGPIAQLIWHRHRDRVAGLVLCATSDEFRVTAAEHMMFASLPALARASRVVPDGLGMLLSARLYAPFLARFEYAAWARSELLLRDQQAVLQAAAALGTYTARDWIGEIDVPTVVLVHRRDQLVPPARQRSMASRIRNAATHFVDADHFAPVRDPEAFTDALAAGLDAVSRADAMPAPLRAAS